MAGRVEGKVALVTGGASGIGRGCAERLAQEGAVIVVTDLQDEKGAETVAAIEAMGAKASYLHHDVTSEQAWIDVIAAIKAQHGRLDVLVNNAGIGIGGSVLTMTLADFQKQTAVNLDGVFLGVKHSIPLMRENGGGSIINMASVASSVKGVPNRFAYTASKAAVIGLTKSVAADYVRQGIRCNAICPGTVDSPSLRQRITEQALREQRSEAEVYAAFVSRQPMGRIGSAQEIAQLALYLGSSASGFTTGTTQIIDGGWSN